MGLEEKTISSSGYTGGSAELVSDPNNILFSNYTYRFLTFLLLMLLSVRRRHIGGTQVPFKVVEREGKYLKQPAENNESEFYVMWVMFRYIGEKSKEANKLVCIIPISFMSVNNLTKWFTDFSLDIIFFERQRKKYNHERLLDMEIVALQSELAKFILAEVLEKDGVFFIAQSVKFKDQYGTERLARLL